MKYWIKYRGFPKDKKSFHGAGSIKKKCCLPRKLENCENCENCDFFCENCDPKFLRNENCENCENCENVGTVHNQ